MWNKIKSWFSRGVQSVRKSAFGLGVRSALGGFLPGAWATDHREEANHFTGWTYIAVHAAAMQASRAVVEVFQDDQQQGQKSRRKSIRRRYGSLSQYKAIQRRLKSGYGKEETEDELEPLPASHPLVKILKHPNPWESGAHFRYRQMQQLRLTGTCFIWNVPGKNVNNPVERYVLPTATVVPQMPTPEFPMGSYRIVPSVSRYYAQVDSNGFTEFPGWYRMVGAVIDAKHVQLIRFPHPIRLDDGQSPLSAGAAWLDAATEIDTARFQQLKNGPAVGAVISPPDNTELSEAEMDAIAAKINGKYAGPANTGKWMVLNPGTTVTAMTGATPEEMRYVEAFDQMKAAALALHQTPPVAVGIQEAGAYAAYNASLRQYRDIAIQPVLDMLAESDTEHLAPQFGSGLTIDIEAEEVHDVELEVRETMMREQQFKLDFEMGLRTFDEWREVRGLDPVGGTKGAEYVVGQVKPMAATGGENGGRKNPLDAIDDMQNSGESIPGAPEFRFGTKTFQEAYRPFMQARG